MTEKEKYIEQVGLFYEQYGLPKMAGRILGYLIVSDSDNNSFEAVQKALKASKGSISGNINLLLNQGMIVKHMISGDRKSYYKMSISSLENILESKVNSVTQFKTILEAGISFDMNDKSTKKENLKNILNYYEFLENEIPLLRMKWEKSKQP
jgi:DNA-binding transcriptional regulator GbsR (MarR family)